MWNFGDISRWIPRQMVPSQAKDFLATPKHLLALQLFGIFLGYCWSSKLNFVESSTLSSYCCFGLVIAIVWKERQEDLELRPLKIKPLALSLTFSEFKTVERNDAFTFPSKWFDWF